MPTLYASFVTLDMAQRAVGALLDQGAKAEDISLVANQPDGSSTAQFSAQLAESEATRGISTTTAGDAVIGAEKGAMVGVGIGTVAALVAMAIPGIGIVIGGGALVAAIVGAAATTAAGAVAGGVTGYLKDQGMGPEVLTRYSTAFESGGTILAIAIPSGTLLGEFAEQILNKYGAAEIATVNGSRTVTDEPVSHIVPGSTEERPLGSPIPTSASVEYPPVVNSADIESLQQAIAYVTPDVLARATIQPTLVNPVTGKVEQAVLIDPYTGFERKIRYENEIPIYVDPTLSEHPVVTDESDTIVHPDGPGGRTITLTGSERVIIP